MASRRSSCPKSTEQTPHKEVRQKLDLAVRLIVDTQNSQGGWRYEPRRHDADISVTVCQVMALRAAHNAGVFVPSDTITRAVEYVKRCQNPDGGFMYQASQPSESEFPRSAAAIVALYSAGIYEGEEIGKGLDYLMRFPPRPNTQGQQNYYMYGHYYAVQAMWHAGGKYWEAWYPAIRNVLLKEQRNDGVLVRHDQSRVRHRDGHPRAPNARELSADIPAIAPWH